MPRIVSRIEKIARDEFPMPPIPEPLPYPTTDIDVEALPGWISLRSDSPDPQPASPRSSQDTNKENSPAPSPRLEVPIPHGPGPAVEPIAGAISTTRFAEWPQAIAIRLAIITNTIETLFTTYPPHTIQRLAELLLQPKRHYKSLPAFLHAVDRVVHVTSGLNVYPLPPAISENFSGTLLSNGVSEGSGAGAVPAPSPWATPGSDEALGGALLTPIPWLSQPTAAVASPPAGSSATATPDTTAEAATPTSSTSPGSGSDNMEGQVRTESTETIEGPNGMGSVETVSVSVNGVPSMGARGVGVTQGELLRQEQKAGVVPVSQLVPGHHARHQGNVIIQQRLSAAAAGAGAGAGASSGAAASALADNNDNNPEDGGERGSEGDEDQNMAVDSDNGGAGGGAAAGRAIASVPAIDEDKPHARGPEEIGLEDTGLQPDPASHVGGETISLTTTGASGSGPDMQGINVEAAVGRKAADSGHAGAGHHHHQQRTDNMDETPDAKNKEDGEPGTKMETGGSGSTTEDGGDAPPQPAADKMDVDNNTDDARGGANTPAGSSTGTIGRSREGTPKRDAEGDAGAEDGSDGARKRLRTSPPAAPKAAAAAANEQEAEGKGESKEAVGGAGEGKEEEDGGSA
ncbi:uncharacterized protein B0I36DRAFT_141647 [Microdochium trichocladiopsis]|uniref:PPP4R2-domain-containing protein n=1 Tax=Microdochium trichocladiopsis TaxID=1682393 RepID=A0A9P9BL35_9PEZI|nr:uncharacterized protein B0I36DRAFT_141647 [Microdochium trichocladiopsis]KAH7027667.1 hypothetical protein B0I36DRAFT_141647 [Microdochium trichocladiopsis]